MKLIEPSRPTQRTLQTSRLPLTVRAGKRAADLVLAIAGLALTAPFWPFIAIAVAATSRGPVLYSQLRVGEMRPDRTILFRIYKFRTMVCDAERSTGPVWAGRHDPRITKLGRILRKFRLDEIPQLWNVLKNDMAIVGPRPERPCFYRTLSIEIPFYAHRTMGIKPGITGLAQVHQGYDTCIDDVRRKAAFDHAYAIRIGASLSWLKTDLAVLLGTFKILANGRGQ